MRTFRFITVAAILAGLFAVSAFAQTPATARIAVINTFEFGNEKGGIAKYIAAQKRLTNEFKVPNQQLTTLATRINNLKAEIQKLQKPANPNVPVSTKTISDKVEEHDRLTRELKFKREDTQAKFNSRANAILGPVNQDIGKALQAFATQRGYAMILDAAKLDRAGLILAFDRKYDVTKAFIAYYNSRPGGTASTTK